jgi:hypothetical protein
MAGCGTLRYPRHERARLRAGRPRSDGLEPEGDIAGRVLQKNNPTIQNRKQRARFNPARGQDARQRVIASAHPAERNKGGDNKIRLSVFFRRHRPDHNTNETAGSGIAANFTVAVNAITI